MNQIKEYMDIIYEGSKNQTLNVLNKLTKYIQYYYCNKIVIVFQEDENEKKDEEQEEEDEMIKIAKQVKEKIMGYPMNNAFKKATHGSIGYDLFYQGEEDIVIPSKGRAIVPTTLRVRLPMGVYLKIVGRSGLAADGILCFEGLIDSDYRKNIKVILFNLNFNESFVIKKGDRIAQFIVFISPGYENFVIETETSSPITFLKGNVDDDTGRGGFGSTGR